MERFFHDCLKWLVIGLDAKLFLTCGEVVEFRAAEDYREHFFFYLRIPTLRLSECSACVRNRLIVLE